MSLSGRVSPPATVEPSDAAPRLRSLATGSVAAEPLASGREALSQAVAWIRSAGWPVAVYALSRVVLLAVAGIVSAAGHKTLVEEMSRFDGQWYLKLAAHGYPSAVVHHQSTLGFFPLYPMLIRVVSWFGSVSYAVGALLISFAGGLVAVVLVQRLATRWWGERAGRRAGLVFAIFPGSIVFSMAYSEGVAIPLVLGCLLALSSERWLVAGLLAGLATAVEPVAMVLIPVAALASARKLHAAGWGDRSARMSLLAPLLAPVGVGAFGAFLWAWTGTPFAAYLAQHYGWYQQSQPLALLHVPIVKHLIEDPHAVLRYLATWNLWNGVLGGVFLVVSLVALFRVRRELSLGALEWTAGMAAITLWSVTTPPNARMILVAAPAVLVWVRRLRAGRLALFVGAELVVFVVASALTFSGHMLP
jgi:hypothetical protein